MLSLGVLRCYYGAGAAKDIYLFLWRSGGHAMRRLHDVETAIL